MAGEDSSLYTIKPNKAAYKEVPSQYMTPFLTDKVGVAHHPDHGGLRITTGIEHVVEFCHRCRTARLQYGGNDDEKVHQTEYSDEVAEELLGDAGVGQKNQEQPERLGKERGDAEGRLDGICRGPNGIGVQER